MNLAQNPNYWNVNSVKVTMNNNKISESPQTIIFDNGMSLAMAPEKSFIGIIKVLNTAGFKCNEGVPIWACKGDDKTYNTLPSLEFYLPSK